MRLILGINLVSDITCNDVMCILWGQADATLSPDPFSIFRRRVWHARLDEDRSPLEKRFDLRPASTPGRLNTLELKSGMAYMQIC